MEENVLRGNSAIVKCHIPSFVTEYVTVSSWIISEGEVDELEIQLDQSFNLGIMKEINGHILLLHPFPQEYINHRS